ncbi:MAG: hypothetical protein CBD16_03425, partial [Betaproteobacteria bacterium TMED156]
LPILNNQGQFLQLCDGKPTTIVSKLDGRTVDCPNMFHCYEIGKALAIAHEDARDFPDSQINTRSLKWWKQTSPKILRFLSSDQQNFLFKELNEQDFFYNTSIYKSLPKAVIHADLFRDNALFIENDKKITNKYSQEIENVHLVKEKLGGIIDFYFAGFDTLLFDLAVVANDWTVHHEHQDIGTFKKNELDSLLNGYQSIRILSSSEIEAWPMILRSAAFRFWVSRLYDWYIPREANLLTPKDPTIYEKILFKRKLEMREKPC